MYKYIKRIYFDRKIQILAQKYSFWYGNVCKNQTLYCKILVTHVSRNISLVYNYKIRIINKFQKSTGFQVQGNNKKKKMNVVRLK